MTSRRNRFAALTVCVGGVAVACGLFFSGVLTTQAVQNPTISLDMVTTGTSYDDTANTMTVGAIDSCSSTAAPGDNTTHNHTVDVVIQNVEDLVAWQIRLNYDGGKMVPAGANFTPFTDSTTGQNISFVNLPIDIGTALHRDITFATNIPAPAPGPQTALIGSSLLGAQTAKLAADTPPKSSPDDTSYLALTGGILARLNLEILAGTAGQFLSIDVGTSPLPGSMAVVFTGSDTQHIVLPQGALGGGQHGEGVACPGGGTPAVVTAHDFKDSNQNGSQDAGELNLAGWTMNLYQGSGCTGAALNSQATDVGGNAVFGGLAAGDYSVAETLLPKWVRISPACQNVTVGPGDSAQVNFGNVLQHKYVVFVGGIAGSLNPKDIAKLSGDCRKASNDPDFGDIKSVLVRNGYACSDFLRYSYEGGQVVGGAWQPNPYSCKDTGNSLKPVIPGSSTQLLNKMLTEFYNAHRDAVFVLVGHSQGGLISFMELEGLKSSQLSQSAPIDGVVTLDSPIGGVPDATFSNLVRTAFGLKCLKDINIYLFSDAAIEIARRSTVDVGTRATVSWALGRSISVTTLGNWDDCVYSPEHCKSKTADLFGEAFPSTALTQIVTNAALDGVPHGTDRMYDLCDSAFPIFCLPGSHTGILHKKATPIGGFIRPQY